MRIVLAAAAALFGIAVQARAADAPIAVVAAENFYGEVAAAIGDTHVAVSSVLLNPNVDPHDFEATPSVARQIADAKVVIYNGADYDPWVDKLLAASPAADRKVIDVAALIGRKPGENPHIWYNPATMPALAGALAAALSDVDPANAARYSERGRAYTASLAPVTAKIAEIKGRYAGAPVTATEPVFGDMAEALGLKMLDGDFQLAVMNETEPSASETAAIEGHLKNHEVKIFFYNPQVTDPVTERLLTLAQGSNVPVVPVTETEPPDMTFTGWMLDTLTAVEKALAGST
jgi:zinc/manganese transport system substrate-binding protein